MLKLNLKLKSLTSAVKSRFPFDWKNPLGYLFAVTIQCIIATYGLKFLAFSVSFEMGAYFFSNALTKDIIGLLKTINKSAKAKGSHTRILKQLTEFVQYHSDVKQLCNHRP